MSIWVMVLIGGLLSTQIANPFFWFRLARGIKRYNCLMRRFRSSSGDQRKPSLRDDVLEEDEIGNFRYAIISNILCFVGTSFILWPIYYYGTFDRTLSAILWTAWLPGIFNIISTCFTFWRARQFTKVEYLQALALAITSILISMTLYIHREIYNYSHQVETNTFLTETEVPVISVDVSTTLEKTVLIDGYKILKPINRNGKVVFPMSHVSEGNISIAGYVELQSDGTPIIIEKDLHYTPYQEGRQNVEYVARDYLPTKKFFGKWSFQLSPDGDVYFARMYGNFECLRAGRVVTGILLINATTGECQTYKMYEVPNWINGISE